MKYDDASWHYGGEGFPEDSPEEYGGVHIGLFLRFCFVIGWAGELHTSEEPEEVEDVISGKTSGTDFLFKNCDGKLTDEDFNDEGNSFASAYYGDDGNYLADLDASFGRLIYNSPESGFDFNAYSKMIESRIASGTLTN
ncbi:hypothetical protein DTL21_05710 [Bremerella cremea]|uniref:DUF7832 domain-containing protein n=1 Tax=Blastopirellula marina TaxID=124 RepID=A0A2S8FZ16_9BACT|nr:MULTISPECIES: hypothetical protein [Pirellulaceae]PQO37439.1 hypothetical protein C5Y83_05710 [Blastopirellula marina]RCS49826.1 hypothetical protein DTL21_05710 [Bremerella cremea]